MDFTDALGYFGKRTAYIPSGEASVANISGLIEFKGSCV